MSVDVVGVSVTGTATNTASTVHSVTLPTGLLDGDWGYLQWTGNNSGVPTIGTPGVETISGLQQNGAIALYRGFYRFPVTAAMSGASLSITTSGVVRSTKALAIVRNASDEYYATPYLGGTTSNTNVSIPVLSTTETGPGLSLFFMATNQTGSKNNVYNDATGWNSMADSSFGSGTPWHSAMLSYAFETPSGGSLPAANGTTTLSSTKLGYRLFLVEKAPYRGWGVPAK